MQPLIPLEVTHGVHLDEATITQSGGRSWNQVNESADDILEQRSMTVNKLGLQNGYPFVFKLSLGLDEPNLWRFDPKGRKLYRNLRQRDY